MVYWSTREELSYTQRLRRSYYELLRDELDQFMLDYSLVQSYAKFLNSGTAYPFVEKRELKPRARIPGVEHESQNTFLVIFLEATIPAQFKKYIRFFNVNQTTKTNLVQAQVLPLPETFDRGQRYIDSAHFNNFLKDLLPVDYALLIQQDPASHLRHRYMLSHFHVRVDWPIAEAAEELGQYLRYISKDLYEKGDRYAEILQKKFFEYFALPVMVGGRRTAAVVAAQYLKRLPCLTTIYVGSAESRAMMRLSERGIAKAVLLPLSEDEMSQIAASHHLSVTTFKKNYLVARERKTGIFVFQVNYTYTNHARPPEDGRLRELNPDVNWLSIGQEFLLPKPGVLKYPPLPVNLVYAS